jgi:flagellar biosynthesis protein FlhB
MSEGPDKEDKTEDATPKKQEDIQKKGQVLRSKELTMFLVLFSSMSVLLITLSAWMSSAAMSMRNMLVFDNTVIHKQLSASHLPALLYHLLGDALWWIGLLCMGSLVLIVIATAWLGGVSFFADFYMPRFDKLSPLKGLARMFSYKSLLELLTSILKVLVVFVGFICVFFLYKKEILRLPIVAIKKAIYRVFHDIIVSWWLMILCIAVIAAVDIVFQWRQHSQDAKMTKNEIKDEHKDTEGKPEVKGKIKQMQRKISQRRMMSKVPKADAILVNPNHYAVAIAYDQATMRAPIVLAKGVDDIAKHICDIAEKAKIPLVSTPPLTRSIYYTTDLDKPIPSGLYIAVAQVLAYVYQLKLYRQGTVVKPKNLGDLPIPEELQH